MFQDDMNRLYFLCFALTAEHGKAEQCFLAAMEDCLKADGVFQNCAQRWSRRMVILRATQMLRPVRSPDENLPLPSGSSQSEALAAPAVLAALIDLPSFERFVYVMSVLERYSVQECAVLLHSSRKEVFQARNRAILQLANILGESRDDTAELAASAD